MIKQWANLYIVQAQWKTDLYRAVNAAYFANAFVNLELTQIHKGISPPTEISIYISLGLHLFFSPSDLKLSLSSNFISLSSVSIFHSISVYSLHFVNHFYSLRMIASTSSNATTLKQSSVKATLSR